MHKDLICLLTWQLQRVTAIQCPLHQRCTGHGRTPAQAAAATTARWAFTLVGRYPRSARSRRQCPSRGWRHTSGSRAVLTVWAWRQNVWVLFRILPHATWPEHFVIAPRHAAGLCHGATQSPLGTRLRSLRAYQRQGVSTLQLQVHRLLTRRHWLLSGLDSLLRSAWDTELVPPQARGMRYRDGLLALELLLWGVLVAHELEHVATRQLLFHMHGARFGQLCGL